eukprot:5492052-Amphidinium_carterae.1
MQWSLQEFPCQGSGVSCPSHVTLKSASHSELTPQQVALLFRRRQDIIHGTDGLEESTLLQGLIEASSDVLSLMLVVSCHSMVPSANAP